jgi:two-component system, OmpR family, phosphate regulon sensor histidine kinase PhoR
MFKNILFRPIMIFIFSLLALGTSLFLYIHWYLQANEALQNFISQYKLPADKILTSETWVIILTLSILVGIIMAGILLIFVYYQMVISLYRQQQNFINGFTHELKTPIASLKLYLETFKKHDLPRDDQQKYLRYMMTDVERLANNVHRILNLAKIEDKRHKTEFSIEDIHKHISMILDKHQHLYKNCKITLNSSDGKDYFYPINPPLFEIMITNLLSNCIIYNESTVPEIKISISNNKDKVQIQVKDNGVGLAKSEFKRIFKKFYQVGKTSKGSGLGLFLVHNIARIHKGNIKAESDGLGKGSTFTLSLPLKAEFNI